MADWIPPEATEEWAPPEAQEPVSQWTPPEAAEVTASDEEFDPWLVSTKVPRKFITELATRYKVPEDALIQQAYLRGGTVEGEERPGLYTASLASEALPVSGGAIAAFAQKKSYSPEQRAAFDLVMEEVDSRKSWARAAAEMLMGIPLSGGIGLAKKVPGIIGKAASNIPDLGRVAESAGKLATSSLGKTTLETAAHAGIGAATGAVGGLAMSTEGREASTAAFGGALGGVLGGTLGGLSTSSRIAREEASTANKVFEDKAFQYVEKAAAEAAPVDSVILDKLPLLTLPDARKVKGAIQAGAKELDTLPETSMKSIEDMVLEIKKTPAAYDALVTRGLDELNSNTLEMAQRKAKQLQEAGGALVEPNDILVSQVLKKDLNDFANYLDPSLNKFGSNTWAETLNKLSVSRAPLSPTQFAQEFENFRLAKVANSPEMRRMAAEQGLTQQRDWLSRTWSVINPSRYEYDKVDKEVGTGIVPLLDNLSASLNKFKNAIPKLQPAIKKSYDTLSKEAKAANMSYDSATGLLYRYLDNSLDDTQKRVVEQKLPQTIAIVKKNFEDFRGVVNTTYGYGDEVVKKWGNSYVPHLAVDFAEGVKRILKETKALANTSVIQGLKPTDSLKAVLENLKKVETPESAKLQRKLQGLQEAVEWLSGKDANTVQDLFGRIDFLQKNQMNPDLIETTTRAQRIRLNENVPSLLRERDLLKLQERYIMTTVKAAAISKTLSRLKATQVVLENLARAEQGSFGKARTGFAAEAARNLKEHIQHVNGMMLPGGMKEWNASLWNKWQVTALQNASEAKSGIGKTYWELAAEVPHALTYLSNQVYPAVLSTAVNPITTLVNLSQPFMYTWPELGSSYGMATALRGYGRLAKNRVVGDIAEMERRGLRGADMSSTLREIAEDATGQTRSKVGRAISGATAKLNDIGMWTFTASELLNRAATFNMGRVVAEDLVNAISSQAKGAKLGDVENGALRYSTRLPEAYKRQIQPVLEKLRQVAKETGPEADKVRAESQRLLEDVFAKHLIGKTIFNYDKASASKFANSIIPQLAVFTKFPINVAADAVDAWRRKGVIGGTGENIARFGIPSAMLFLTDQILQEQDGEVMFDRTWRELLSGGSPQGLMRYGLASAGAGLLGGEWASPPIVAPLSAVGYAFAADTDKVAKNLKETAKFYLPAPLTNTVTLWNRLADAGLVGEPPWQPMREKD